MVLSYWLRVACVVGVSLGLLQVAIEAMLWAGAPALLRLIEPLPLRQRERALYLVQVAPVALAILLTSVFFLPQYLANETNLAPERVSWLCLALALGLYGWWSVRMVRGIRIAVRTLNFSRACRQGSEVFAGETPVIMVAGERPRVVLVGLTQPFILLSRSLVEVGGLRPLALEVVLDHERSHAAQRDNWKLLTLYCLPRLNLELRAAEAGVPKTWMQLWQSVAEWAADDDAVGGSSDRALALAETLVALARFSSAPDAWVACTYLLCADTELSLRVERLLRRSSEGLPAHDRKVGAFLCGIAVGGVTVLAALSSVLRDLPERLLHLG